MELDHWTNAVTEMEKKLEGLKAETKSKSGQEQTPYNASTSRKVSAEMVVSTNRVTKKEATATTKGPEAGGTKPNHNTIVVSNLININA